MTSDLWTWTAGDLARGIATGRISSVEATRSALSRLDAVNPAINAVVDPLHEDALAAAEAADKALRRGEATGALHGVPVTVKINVDYGGRPTTNGVVAFKDLTAPEDGSVVRSLKASGAVIVGRTNTPCFSMRWYTDNDLHGATLNPWDPGRTPGGSSGGAAAATAVGIGAVGHGNDLGGSIRYPAYCCGLVGLRPTSGIAGAFNPSQAAERPIVSQMASVQGPLARSIEDAARAMQALSLPDPRDVWQIAPPAAPGALGPCRVAVLESGEGCPTDPAVTNAIRRAARILAEAGYEIVDVAPPSLLELGEYWRLMLGAELYATLWPLVEAEGDDAIRIQIERCHGVLRDRMPTDPGGFLKLLGRRSTLLREWQAFFAQAPLLLTASSWAKPHPLGADVGPDADYETFFRQQVPSAAPPVIGLPGLSVPMGVEDGLPTGVQLLSARFWEPLLLAAGAALERAQGPVAPIDPVAA
ncbi:amidase [Albimonas sp. CAU 1670]|uniref:amidase n=1 Tax=Albimonas sp. CAU 1670 TaxID=3032599 RepID=UPI0023DBEDFE|nr:amidase [Albimonas sp. CAU 1670]MDF2233335.1 amidase [Albimonas sp. CAU 1670]